jgi:starch synthase
MSKKKVLIVSQELNPYTESTDISEIARKLSQYAQDGGMEIRVLMPRFGTINERRHRLHEVVRLSGMNIIVNDDDYPLIIKVASLPGARMQVYFLDNEDFFKRKAIFQDDNGEVFDDNLDRMVFFCKGVLETVKKFGWPPDIIHCHGWMTSLIPLYLKTAYKNEPLFRYSKVVYSIYSEALEHPFSAEFLAKASINNLDESLLLPYQNGTDTSLHAGAIALSDAIVKGAPSLPDNVSLELAKVEKPLLDFQEGDDYFTAIIDFYQALLKEEVEG